MFVEPEKQKVLTFITTKNEIDDLIDSNNKKCPFYDFIGNKNAILRLTAAGVDSLNHRNHLCDKNFAFVGPPSVGKTTLAKKFSNLLQLPFIEIYPRTIKKLDDIFDAVSSTLGSIVIKLGSTGDKYTSLKLVPNKDTGIYQIPPCVIFIDEVHCLPKNIVQGLLKVTERKDGMLCTESGHLANFQKVTFIIATTERGKLFDAFDTRFTKIQLESYSLDEVAQIVKINNSDWDLNVCKKVATYNGLVPREAIEFAEEMRSFKHIFPNDSWEQIAKKVASARGIDEYGLTKQKLNVLIELNKKPLAMERLCKMICCKVEELEKFVMPSLLLQGFCTMTGRGYAITEEGVKQLEKRN